ncbi:hypothetical protein Tco_0570871 [Tanacetum coccineum]
MHTVAGDGVSSIKRRRRDPSSDGVKNLATTSGRGRLKEDLESSTWGWRSSNSDTDKIMARMDAMTMKMDAEYKEFQSRSKQPNLDHNDDDIPISRKEEAKFMQTFHRTRFYNDYRDRDSNRDN